MPLDFFVNNASMEYFLDKGSTDVTQQILPLDFSTLQAHPNAFDQAMKAMKIVD